MMCYFLCIFFVDSIGFPQRVPPGDEVWPQLVVDPDRAPVIRYVTLGLFKQETNKEGGDNMGAMVTVPATGLYDSI